MSSESSQPGYVCAHTHLYSGLAPLGMPAPEPAPENFLQILERVWWRLDLALDEASLRASARLYVAEALLAGTTTLVDHHESPRFIEGSLDVLADAAQELGARLLVCYGATERNGGRDEARAGLGECRRFIEENERSLVRGMIALHASFTVSDATVREAGELARALGTVTHVHVAEDAADVADAKQRGYDGPLERLMELDALPAGSILAHGVHLNAAQVKRAGDAGYWLVQNPRSNKGNGVGYPRHLDQSPLVALGTDGYDADMREELSALEAEARENSVALSGASARAQLERGRELAAQRFGLSLGELDAQDSVTLDDEGRVRQVRVAGADVVRDGDLLNGDIDAIRAEAQTQAQRLWARMRAV
ncbi:MAG: amidohydrolase family protein [Deltaproteobacteria bacterium]|nr:amidohydrolase family protein [Deltaproteobacteria bacterium]